jgi:tetratricopeptide (TPR) repeat protein
MRCRQCAEPNPADRIECLKCGEPLLDALDESGIVPAPVGATLVSDDATQPALEARAQTAVPAAAPTEARDQMTGSLFGGTGPTSGATAEAPTLRIGALFGGRYEIVKLLGQGGMGSVYAARDREIDRLIALKTIRGENDPLAVQRFKQELLFARKITHKNVVRIHDLGEAEGLKYFTMEYIEGDGLKELIRKQGKLPASRAVALAQQVLAGLSEAHAQGVVHRDLKPQNVMVDPQGIAHLMDFGIARSADTTGMTGTGMIVGTPDYMSPEQVRGEKADERSDIFSFGVILYEMLTGEVPYQGDTPVSKIVMRLSHKPRPPHELTAELPAYLEAVVLKCMEIDAASRYPTVAAILADLGRQQVDQLSLTVRAQRAVTRHKTVIVAVAAVAFAAAGGFWWAGRGRAVPPPPAEGPLQSLAILPFTNATGQAELEWMRTGIPEMLVTDLSQSRFVRPVSGERVNHVLQQAGLAQQSRFDESALETVSKLARAQTVLAGQFVESGGKLRLDLRLRKAGSGVSLPIEVQGETGQVFALVDQIARRLKERLDLTPDQIKGDASRPIGEVTTASLDAARAYHAGLAQLRQGANQEAVTLLKQAVAADPKFPLAHAKLAEAYFNSGQDDDAAPAIDRAVSLADKSALPVAERYQIHALAAVIKEDYETAARSYRELARLYPADPDIQLSLAKALEKMGKYAEALENYKKVVAEEPSYGAALLGLGRVQVVTGQPEPAIRSLLDTLATKQFEEEPEALGMIYSILGVAYRDTGQLDRALEALDKSFAYRVKTKDLRGQAVTLYNLASVYEFRGEIDRALAAEKKALSLAREAGNRAEESVALFNMGLTYKAAGKLDPALGAIRQALQIDMERGDHRALANRLDKIADIYRLKGQYDDALVYLEQAKTHIAQSDEKQEKAINLNYIAQVRQALGLYDQALEAYLASLPIFKEIGQEMGVAMTEHNLAEIYVTQGRYADALAAFDQSLELYRKLKVVHDVAEVQAPRGHLLATLGQGKAAEEALAEAERVAREAKAEDVVPEILLGRAELARSRGQADAASLFEQANVKANLSGQKEVAVESRIELGRLYLDQGKLDRAAALLLRTREEAAAARLRPLEAEAAVALAEVYLAKKDAEAARRQAQDAIKIAERFAGRPVLHEAHARLGAALERLGRSGESIDAYAQAAQDLDWIRGSLRPQDVESFMKRPEAQGFLKDALPRLERGGRSEAAALKKWAGATAPGGRS